MHPHRWHQYYDVQCICGYNIVIETMHIWMHSDYDHVQSLCGYKEHRGGHVLLFILTVETSTSYNTQNNTKIHTHTHTRSVTHTLQYPVDCPSDCPVDCPLDCPVDCPLDCPLDCLLECPLDCSLDCPITITFQFQIPPNHTTAPSQHLLPNLNPLFPIKYIILFSNSY